LSALRISFFFDFTCPFSYVTGAALREPDARGDVVVRARAVERFPAPAPLPSPAEEGGWEEAVRPLAEALGLPLRVPGFRPRTRKAHEAAWFAQEQGAGRAMREAIFAAYWGEERDIGRIDVLADLAEGAGLDPVSLRIALDIDRYRGEVLRDEETAERLRIRATPVLFLGSGPGARILVGAQGREQIESAITNHEF